MTRLDEIKEFFADELQERMEEDNLRPYHIAYFCRVSPEVAEEYVNGKELPGVWELILLAENLGCSVNDLLGFGDVDHPLIYERYLASDMFINGQSYAACFADRLKTRLINRDLHATDIAAATGIRVETVRSWTSKRPKLPRTMQLISTAEFLKSTPSDLLGY